MGDWSAQPIERCHHVNSRGYGQCILRDGHEPYNSGGGVYYEHSYAMRTDNPAAGSLDVFESVVKPLGEEGEIWDSVNYSGMQLSWQRPTS